VKKIDKKCAGEKNAFFMKSNFFMLFPVYLSIIRNIVDN
jgi:hypothetical protein